VVLKTGGLKERKANGYSYSITVMRWTIGQESEVQGLSVAHEKDHCLLGMSKNGNGLILNDQWDWLKRRGIG